MTDTILEYADLIPPWACRMVARRNHKGQGFHALTTEEIVKASGLDRKTVLRLSRATTFADVHLRVVDAFRKGCGITRKNQKRHIAYLKHTRLKHRHRPLAHLDSMNKQMKNVINQTIATL